MDMVILTPEQHREQDIIAYKEKVRVIMSLSCYRLGDLSRIAVKHNYATLEDVVDYVYSHLLQLLPMKTNSIH